MRIKKYKKQFFSLASTVVLSSSILSINVTAEEDSENQEEYNDLNLGTVVKEMDLQNMNSDLLSTEIQSFPEREHKNGIYKVSQEEIDTFYSIAGSFNISVRQLEVWNPNVDANNISIGTELAVTKEGVEKQLSGEKYERLLDATYIPPYSAENIDEFITEFAPKAIEISNQEGEEPLWPSLMIAQALHESGAARRIGMSQLSSPPHHNLFGIKASSGNRVLSWTWEAVDDRHNENGENGTIAVDILADFQSFTNYGDALQGYADFLRTRQFNWDDQEYYYSGTWASNTNSVFEVLDNGGLRGYATDPNYFNAIRNYINNYDLTRFDPVVERVQGDTRYSTAVAISQEGWDHADTVVIANAYEYADALAGVPLAHQLDAPILLSRTESLDEIILSEIDRLGATNAIILGGEYAISENVVTSLKDKNISTDRLSGDTRYETAGEIASKVLELSNATEAILVSGEDFADAMSVAPFAASKGLPIFLTRSNTLAGQPSEAAREIKNWRVIGGPNAISHSVTNRLQSQRNANIRRIYGDDRYFTNQSVIRHFGVVSNEIFVATGENFVDALTGSVLASKQNTGVVLSADKQYIVNRNIQFARQNTFSRFTFFGGEHVLSSRIEDSLKNLEVTGF